VTHQSSPIERRRLSEIREIVQFPNSGGHRLMTFGAWR